MNKIEGVPEGWELVRIGCLNDGEWAIGGDGKPWQFKGSVRASRGNEFWPIIRRIEPVCTWPHGVFADGWIAEDKDGCLSWLAERPLVDAIGVWKRPQMSSCDWMLLSTGIGESVLLNPPKFRDDLPWTERIQAVGPTIEATLKEAT